MNKVNKVMMISLVTNTFLSVFKVVCGLLFKTNALISDGIHSFSDLTTDVIALIGIKMSKKPADSKHPYGHGKTEYLISIIIGLAIMSVGGTIIVKMTSASDTNPELVGTLFILITIIIKIILAKYVISNGKKHKNAILIASGSESKSDVIGSIIVLLSVILYQFKNYIGILKYSDQAGSLIIGLFVLKIGFDVIRDNFSKILGEQIEDSEYLNDLKEVILNNKAILDIEELVVLQFGYYHKLIATVNLNPNINLKKAHDVVDSIENRIKKFDSKIKYTTIHMHPYNN